MRLTRRLQVLDYYVQQYSRHGVHSTRKPPPLSKKKPLLSRDPTPLTAQ
jgi:hypothetical protein